MRRTDSDWRLSGAVLSGIFISYSLCLVCLPSVAYRKEYDRFSDLCKSIYPVVYLYGAGRGGNADSFSLPYGTAYQDEWAGAGSQYVSVQHDAFPYFSPDDAVYSRT